MSGPRWLPGWRRAAIGNTCSVSLGKLMAGRLRILVTGCRGQMGRDLMEILSRTNHVTGVDHDELDIRDRQAARSLVARIHPDAVIHAAAYTDVDGGERDRELAFAVNEDGTRNIAMACREAGALMVYYSTDYVFDGTSGQPYEEDDIPSPATVYGQSKL